MNACLESKHTPKPRKVRRNMETIAPLAKVLAEANGIEWRSLHGTGEAGLITEQDILVYLARVMSGEEDAPLTPVDPEPSPAELAAYSSPELLSRAGVEADLTDFIKLQETMRDAPPPAPAPPAPVRAAPLPSAPEPLAACSPPRRASRTWPRRPPRGRPSRCSLSREPVEASRQPAQPPASAAPPVTPALPVEDDFELERRGRAGHPRAAGAAAARSGGPAGHAGGSCA